VVDLGQQVERGGDGVGERPVMVLEGELEVLCRRAVREVADPGDHVRAVSGGGIGGPGRPGPDPQPPAAQSERGVDEVGPVVVAGRPPVGAVRRHREPGARGRRGEGGQRVATVRRRGVDVGAPLDARQAGGRGEPGHLAGG
jgi:hypothetical protein